MNLWAIQDEDLEVYYAAQQYGPPGSVTVASGTGSSSYSPMTFRSEEQAKHYLKDLRERHPKTHKGYRWKVVPFGN